MDTSAAASRLQALANPARLRIYEILSQAGEEGLDGLFSYLARECRPAPRRKAA